MLQRVERGGSTIAVIGTPIDQYYPPSNKKLQDFIAANHLLISEIPFYQYHKESFPMKRYHFPQRNITMSAISEGTVIVEASDRSGTLTQARQCLQQGRKLFILRSCVEKSGLKWPTTYVKRGAVVVDRVDDILKNL